MKDPMKYGKASGIALLQKYLPKLSPFKSMYIINNIDEWNKIKGAVGHFVPHRVDYPLGNSRLNVVAGTDQYADVIPELIAKLNDQSPDGVILILPTKNNLVIPPRYEDEGGFTVLFNMGLNVIIELVGRGFDGHEVTQGKACHEKYQIPWNEVLFMRNRKDMLKSNTVQKSHISQEDYQKTRKERIDFLYNSCHYDIDKIEENIPQTYSLIPDNVIVKLLDEVVLELMKNRPMLLQDGLMQFGIQGNIINGEIQPWEMFRPERWLSKGIKLEKER